MHVQTRAVPLRLERGATIVHFALIVMLMLGFAGIALDLSRLFIVKSELQTAMDSCALGGAQELDGKAGAVGRAKKAALLAGNLNHVNLQSASWDNQAKIIPEDVELLDAALGTNPTDASARYVRCSHTQTGITAWLLHIMGARSGNTAAYPREQSVFASATATRGSAQTTCPVPVGLIAKPGKEGEPNWGYARGDWVVALSDTNSKDDSLVPGEMGWFNLDGSQAASITNAQLSESNYCNTVAEEQTTLLTPGSKEAVSVEWNYRFGIYKSDDVSRSANRPDMTGYGYGPNNWTAMSNAYPDFLAKRASYEPFQFTKPPFKSLASKGQLQQYGYNRRIVLVPVLNFIADRDYKIINFACMLLLGPMKMYSKEDVYMEFLGRADDVDSPCTTGGKPGGIAGPKVPTLVR